MATSPEDSRNPLTSAPVQLPLGAQQVFSWLLLIAFGIFLVGFLVVPKAYELAHFKFFRSVVFLLLLLNIPVAVRLLRGNRLFSVFVLYVAYMLATVLWSDVSPGYDSWAEGTWQVVRSGVLIIVFVITVVVLNRELPDAFDALIRASLAIAGAVAIVTMATTGHWDNSFTHSRLVGISFIANPVLTGVLYGFLALLATIFLLQADSPRARIVYVTLLAVLSAYVLLTQSRTAGVALLLGITVLFFGSGKRQIIFITSVLAFVISLWVIVQPNLLNSLLREIPARPRIWLSVAEHSLDALVAGHGYLSDTRVQFDELAFPFVHAHSAYLATLRDGGLVGFTLLLALLGYALRLAYRVARDTGDYAYLAMMIYAAAAILPDMDRLLVRPHPLWLFLWLPIALVIAKTGAGDRQHEVSQRAEH